MTIDNVLAVLAIMKFASTTLKNCSFYFRLNQKWNMKRLRGRLKLRRQRCMLSSSGNLLLKRQVEGARLGSRFLLLLLLGGGYRKKVFTFILCTLPS